MAPSATGTSRARAGLEARKPAGPGFAKYIHPYILSRMSERAKIFQNGGSQAVRLPKSCRFDDDQQEVIVRRVGNQVILEPADEWSAAFLGCLGAWTEDIPRPATRVLGSNPNAFERS